MLQFTFKFTCKFTCILKFTFTSKLLITLIPFMLHVCSILGMIFTQTKTLDFTVELPLGLASGWGQGSECITLHKVILNTCKMAIDS